MESCEYMAEVVRTSAVPGDESFISQLDLGALGLAGEAGEVVDIIKKFLYAGRPLDEGRLVEGLGDVLWYAALICHAVGTSIGEVMAANVEKLRRRYPDGFAPDRSVHRSEED
jgi:NTP pyrophosphatase (non-canonical NTP hydrolase)